MCHFSDPEEWRVVPSDPSLEASSWGRIRVIPWRASNNQVYGGVPTWGQWDGARFLYARKGYKTRKVARLVFEAFNGPIPENQVVMHDDEDSRHNWPSNLKAGTQKQNLNYPGFIEYCKSRTGDANPHRKGKGLC